MTTQDELILQQQRKIIELGDRIHQLETGTENDLCHALADVLATINQATYLIEKLQKERKPNHEIKPPSITEFQDSRCYQPDLNKFDELDTEGPGFTYLDNTYYINLETNGSFTVIFGNLETSFTTLDKAEQHLYDCLFGQI